MSCVLAQLVHHHDPFPHSPSFVSAVCKLNGVVLLPVPARTTTTMSLHSVSFARAVLLKASSFCLTRSLLVVCPCLRCCMLVLNRGKTTVDIQVVNYVFFLSLVCRLAWGSNQPFLCCWTARRCVLKVRRPAPMLFVFKLSTINIIYGNVGRIH